MRPKFLAGLAIMALAPAILAQPSTIWQNPGFFDASTTLPIDALTFWNPSGTTFVFSTGVDPYQTFDTLNYTNQGIIDCNPGFDFETFPTTVGQVGMAANFVNQASGVNGVINCTSGIFGSSIVSLVGNLFFAQLSGSAQCIVAATNIINSGTVSMDASSLMKFTGENVDMTRGTLVMANLTSTNFGILTNAVLQVLFGFGQSGWLDGYWGAGAAIPARNITFPLPNLMALPAYPGGVATFLDPFVAALGASDSYEIVTRNELATLNALSLQFPVVYVQDSGIVGSNRWVEAVFLQDNNPAFLNTVYFPNANLFGGTNPPTEVAVQWQWAVTNFPSGAIQTNYIFVTDNFGEVTNIGIDVDGEINRQAPVPEFTYKPENYNIVLGVPFTDFFQTTPATPSALAGGALGAELGGIGAAYTNQYAAYEAIFTSANQLTTDVAGGNVTNLSGRIEITAKNTLDLTGARITPLNYLLLNSTNHFKGAINAQIASPNSDFYLRTTNGVLLFTNLVQPYLPNALGPCELWSARYTNVENNVPVPGTTNVITVTNSYHILFVDSEFAPVTPTFVQTLDLTVTNFTGARNNLYLSDVINVSNILLTSDAITITTNGPGATNPSGQLNMLNPNTLWPTAMPNLQYLTNYGQISNANSVFFGGSHTQPPYNPNLVNVPYQAFVNSNGLVINQGSQIWSLYFQNGSTNAGGTFQAGNGSIILQQCFDAVLMNGAFYAGGDVTIDSASLLVSNHIIVSGGALTLSNSYYLDDGSYATASAFGVTNKNFWSVENGINLPVLPTYASLLGTTITNIDVNNAAVQNTWAGADLGLTPAGFSGNAALGHLILDGQDPNSEFDFNPAGAGPNAIYVDLLELNNSANKQNPQGNASNIRISPEMKIYYGRALADGEEISEKLNGSYGVGQFGNTSNSGQFFWVSNYNCGFFSSTNIVYSDGSTNQVNMALAISCDIVSNPDHEFNCLDRNPINPIAPCPAPPTPVIPAPAPLAAPAIALASPSAGATYTAPATVPLSASVAANGHSIARVLFYDGADIGATLLASNTVAPYGYTWTNVAAGNYTPTAVLVYDQGYAVVASPVSLTVKDGRVATPAGVGLVPPPADTNMPGPFKFKGVYHGLFYDTNAGVNASSAGYFTAATTTGGGVSAKIALGGRTYSFTGSFGGSGTTAVAAKQGSASLNVQLQLSSDNQQIQGTISQGASWSATLQADLQAPAAAGSYTLVIPPATNGPQGYGIGSVTVDAKGNLKWSGVLADGTKVTQSSAVSQQGFWPLYAPLYSGGGAVLSWMQFISGGVDGDLIWIRPAGGAYPAGFTADVEAMGSAYSKPPAGTRVLDWPGGMGNVIFDGGGLSAPITNQISLSSNNKVKDVTGTYKLTLNITTSSGLFSGSLSRLNGKKRVPFSGAIWDGTNGAGFFLNPNDGESGSVLLQP